jgi:hypothetical protein
MAQFKLDELTLREVFCGFDERVGCSELDGDNYVSCEDCSMKGHCPADEVTR